MTDTGAALAGDLQRAADDAGLSDATRALVLRAHDELLAARRDAEAARRRYQALFDAVPDPVSLLDENGVVLDLNRAGLAAYRRPRGEIVGQPIHVLNPELPQGHLAPVLDTLKRGGSYVVEVTNMRGDGSRFPVEVHSGSFIHDGRDCIVAVARDLSERHAAELRYRELMETIDRGILVHDADGSIRYANPAAMRIFHIGEGETLQDALLPERWCVVDEHGEQLLASELPYRRALQCGRTIESVVLGCFHRQRHQLTWVSATSVPQFSPGSHQPQQALTLFSDVTSLKRDSALFDRAQALAGIGGWEWDAGRDELYLTAEAQRILGRDGAPTRIDAILDRLDPSDRERARQQFTAAGSTADGIDLELRGTRPGGERFWMRVIGKAASGLQLANHLTGTLQDITRRKQAEDALRTQAQTDSLTGLANRVAVLAELDARLSEPARANLAVLYVDLDRFKVVNDVLGHAAGDRLLVSAARRLQRAVGDQGLIARFGGDEFLVVCAAGSGVPERLAAAILSAFGDSFRLDGEEFSITASVGIAVAPADGTSSQQLIQSADVAMYDSKRRGRNGVQAFTPELAVRQLHRVQLETHLRRAVQNNEFHLVYQPQVDLGSGRLVAAEALIRWHNPLLGEMRPDHFIDYAETTGDIVGIGGWVMREACREFRRWRELGLDIERIAVNVSYRQFLGEDLASNVRRALADADLPGSALELEFTERVLIEDEPETLRAFSELRAMGVMLTIDDFGEGYSALNYLRRLPIHGLKLSQLFVQGVPGNQSDVAVCQAVIGIAASLGLGLLAEGVETPEQRAFLMHQGVTLGQGFLFAPGLGADELLARYLPGAAGEA